MIDMNQSIENIMEECDRIAFNEFKSDIDHTYARRQQLEKMSHSHSDSDNVSRSLQNNKTGIHVPRYSTAKGLKSDPSYRGYGNDLVDEYDDRKSIKKSIERNKEKKREEFHKLVKANSESASIFDTLLDQV